MKSTCYFCQILVELEFSRQILASPLIPNFMKILLVGTEFLHADGRTDRHDEANSRFSRFCESAQKSVQKSELG